MTVLPNEKSELTGDTLPGTAQVKETRGLGFNDTDETDDESWERDEALRDQIEQEDPEDPNYAPFEVRLADTFEDINTSEYQVDPGMANSIAQVDLGNSPEAITVQHLAASVYNGNISPEEAFQAAVESGYDADILMENYYALKSHFE